MRHHAHIAALLLSTIVHGQTSFQVGSTTVHVDVMASGLEVPWDLVLGPDGFIWFTQATGEVYRMHPQDGTLQLVHTLADVHVYGFTAGLHSMAFHPDFGNEPYIYLHYLISNEQSVIRRFLYDPGSNSLSAPSEHLLDLTIAAGPSHNGSRMIVDEAGMFLISIGECMNGSVNAQNPLTSHGKVLRFAPDGSVPPDNPVAGSYVYNWGHRNPQGLVKAANGHIYNSAHGAGNDDEVNIILPDRDYGWPTVLGLCNTTTEIAYCEANDVIEPIHEFTQEVVAPSGMDHFDHPSIPDWQNSLLVATLRGKELRQLKLDASGLAVLEDNTYLSNSFGRLRDVLVHPDGRIFISTSNHDWSGTPTAADDRILALSGDIGTQVGDNDGTGAIVLFDPANGQVRWDGPCEELAVLDAAGRMVRQVMKSSVLDVHDLPAGLYTVRGRESHGRWRSSRLFVEHD